MIEIIEIPRCTLTVFPDVVVLPSTDNTSTSNSQVTISGGSTVTETNFNCSTINLRKGSSGEDVKKLQTILKAKGFYNRQIDGSYGNYTVAAVKKLQTAQGNTPDGWFGSKTCQKLQSTNTTSNNTTKNKSYTITDIESSPQVTRDMEALSTDITLKTEFTTEKLNRIRRLQKTEFKLAHNGKEYVHKGYVNNIKISHDSDAKTLEIQLVGYNIFLDQSVEFEKTAKQSELAKELIKLAGLKSNIILTGLTDNVMTIKSTVETSSNTTSAGGGLTTMSGNDCSETYDISTRSYNINESSRHKIGNSSANYASGTSSMNGKDAIMSIYNRFRYSYYENNRTCPQKMYNGGTIRGNCADISRLVMCVGQVHGMNVGIHHMSGHYYNLIEVGGKTYRFDCCCKSSGSYHGEVTNTLTMRGGPW